MDDLISRQAVLDLVNDCGICIQKIIDLPSVNPQKWIPLSDKLPEENKAVLLGVRYKDDFKYFVTMRCDYNYWTGIGRDLKGIGYWMPLPEPYKGVEE